jgi:hypothetical protein
MAYVIVSAPAVIPVTMPPETAALALTAPHVPPVEVSDKVIVAISQTDDGPVIAPGCGKGFTVTGLSTTVEPQKFVMV